MIPVEDRLAIQELVARYAFRCDTARYAEIPELFAEDGVWDETVIGAPVARGHEELAGIFAAVGAQIEHLIHVNANHQLTSFDGDHATGTVHLLAEGVFGGRELRIRGYYDDEYVRRDDGWRFARRRLVEIFPTTGLEGGLA